MMANYLTDIVRRAEKYGEKNSLGKLLSALEVGANMGTSGFAQLGGGLSYIPAAIIGGDAAGQATKKAVEEAFTYAPRTKGANNFFNTVGGYLAPVADYGAKKVDQAADAAFRATGSPAVGAAVKTLPTALSQVADRARVGQLFKRNSPVMEMTAYHGSPHDFDQFDINKIGTGEGAQAYGHGLYFAESPHVAKEYQRNLTESGGASGVAANLSRMYKENALDVAKSKVGIGTPENQSLMRDVVSILESGSVNKGRLYTVDIPDEAVAKFLDWDKPLSQQPQVVRDAYAAYLSSPDAAEIAKDWSRYKEGMSLSDAEPMLSFKGDPYGDNIYRNAFKSREDANKWLGKFGIQGIRYLDQGSRQGGKGTSNFVVFDDKLVKMLKKE